MTIEQMHDVVEEYCESVNEVSDTLCGDCQIEELCSPIMGSFLDHPDICLKAYEKITGESPDPKANVVDHPSHYNQEGAMEAIDEMILVFGKTAVIHFCLCNVWKYRYRANAKNGDEDMKKANWYMAKYKELTNSEWED